MRARTAGAVLILAGMVGAAPCVHAELIYFAAGGEVQAPANVTETSVTIDVAGRSFEFLRSDFRAIVPGYCPEREWPARRAAALAGGAAERYAAAWWALENGLAPQAEAMLREAHASDPKHQPTARTVATLERLARPCLDPDLEPVRRALGAAFDVTRTPHVVLFHQHPAEEARERAELLERVVVTFYLLMSSQGIDLPVSRERMASAIFAEQSDYLAYLNAENLGVFRSTRGYYHPTLRSVIAYDSRSAGGQKQTSDALRTRAAELRRMEEFIDRMPPRGRLQFAVRGEPSASLSRAEARRKLSDLRRDLARRELLFEAEWRAIDLGTAAHEMIHQLVAASGLAPHHDDFPTWLHEGFAAQFEVIRGGRWAGVGRAHDLRLPDWRSVQPVPELSALLQGSGFGRGYRRDSYAHAWALVYYLRKEQPQQFVTFLDLLRRPDPELPRPKDRASESFRSAFGADTTTLQDAFRRYLSSVRTPLEEHRRPEPRPPAATPDPASLGD